MATYDFGGGRVLRVRTGETYGCGYSGGTVAVAGDTVIVDENEARWQLRRALSGEPLGALEEIA